MVDWRQHLTRNPQISGGQLCASGTRIPVTIILANMADGLTREQLQTQYPSSSFNTSTPRSLTPPTSLKKSSSSP